MKAHSEDEIGLLTQRVNALLDAAESAINQVKTQHKELERMATHDFLTGLPTLRLAEDRLRIACANADRMDKKVALLFIDLDGFKAINDTLGHEAGDEVLREAARAMQQCIRAQDTIGRIGGDEFLIILGGISRAEEAAGVAEKLIAALTRKIATAEQALDLGASIGIALYPDHANHADTLRRAADLAMYTVKRSGKGAYAFA
jgi:diguanylate cyclase (GGDEF)-like protein